MGYAETFEDRGVVFWRERSPAVGVLRRRGRPRKGEEAAGDDPVHVAVLDLLVELVLLVVEAFVVVPAELYAVLKPAQAVQNLQVSQSLNVPCTCTCRRPCSRRGTARTATGTSRTPSTPPLRSTYVNEFFELSAKAVSFRKIERPEVSEEGLVHEVLRG